MSARPEMRGIGNTEVSISVDDVTVDEDAGVLTFTISASSVPSTAIDVNFSTSDLSALAGPDYTAIAGTAVIPTTTSSTTVDIPILETSSMSRSKLSS